MLTYSDRQKFEQIRARWETAQPTAGRPQGMAGRKEKPAAHQPLNTDTTSGGGSKFRRKLSHGLSFISNPLSQRKTTPGRLQLGRQSLAPGGPSIAINTNRIVEPRESDRLLSPIRDSRSFDDSRGSSVPGPTSKNDASANKNTDPDTTPKPLPRSRTMSFIPRPNRRTSESSIVESESTPKLHSPPFALDSQTRTISSKIPTPPATQRRRSSPRQYTPQHTTQQAKHIAAGMAFAGAGPSSPSKASVRSYTTPNLIHRKPSPQARGFMMPRKSVLQHKHSGPPSVQRLSMKENTPTGKGESRRISQIQEVSSRRLSMTAPTVASSKLSSGLSGSPRLSKQAVRTTPPNAKRLSTSVSIQTPLTAKRMQPNKQSTLQSSTSYRYSNGSSIAQSRLMGTVNPPTPQVAEQVAAQTALPRASTDRNLRKKTFTRTSSGQSGAGMSSRSLHSANTEVRLPRSSTFHNFWSHRDPPPPVPPIPEQYRTLSQPLLVIPESHEQHHPLYFIPEQESVEQLSKVVESGAESFTGISSSPFVIDPDESKKESTENDTEWPLGPIGIALSTPPKPNRPWSIHDQHVDIADIKSQLQVKDHMPPLWWAGRFQSRYDQWRTEAMMAELDPKHKPEGIAGRCSLSQDKTAACYIFLQLRDLCVSNQAADSLWEFEYRYRQEHKLLGEVLNTPTYPKRKLDDNRQGPIGRAVRKLTPRKSSLVNLLKGKGWSKTEGIAEHTTTPGMSQGASSDTS
ncbi:hypothetical protein K505DRAFT_248859 [Melanomma pulvis-pyrius CBS 109.77]|uniref:Uncharacterized protein n=1 Tax=Melanomma pulvis-pyrius CBS 109.77 TaxID=1314802 RepID=A0A6A6X6D3_9PLEO|nr:hypothetical protein K505DRAFT_248859 [Melanomma pulvis-pyrius CBS 109.77]